MKLCMCLCKEALSYQYGYITNFPKTSNELIKILLSIHTFSICKYKVVQLRSNMHCCYGYNNYTDAIGY